MYLDQAYVLLDYWAEWPPAHEAVRLAWFKPEEKTSVGGARTSQASNNGDVGAFFAMEGVSSEWRGPPPMKIADVIELAERAKSHGRQ